MLVNEEESDSEYCTSLVMKHDRERLLCAMLAPEASRPALIALLAWNHEIAKIGEMVSDSMVGLIRFQWWSEVLDEIYENKHVRDHAVAQELAEAIRRHRLPKEEFEAILTAREADLQSAPFASLNALDRYAIVTVGGLLKLWLLVLGVREEIAFDAAQHAGAAWALVGILRSIHHQAHNNRVLLPTVEAQKLLQHGFDTHVADAVKNVCELAEEHIALARRISAPSGAISALLLVISAEDYIERIKAAGYNPFDPSIEEGRAYRAFKLWWGKVRKRY